MPVAPERPRSLMSRPRTWGLWLLGVLLLVFVVLVPMDVPQQSLFSAVLFAAGLALLRSGNSLAVLVMMGISLVVSSRYIWWRLTETLAFGDPFEFTLAIGLVLADVYYFVAMTLGYFQSMWPLKRKPVPLPADQGEWPSVDVFIPTYNESLEVVRTTVLAASVIDWPADKLNIYLLDDGRRAEFRDFCAAVGVHYVTRSDNAHAKAGNINAALKKSSGDYVAVFDCDHIPTRSFLQVAMGLFLRDEKLAVVQTPHYFFSADPFERNLDTYGKVPNEGELFYGLLQDGNDQWDATFFCGSCTVIKRKPLEEVGGVAVETVTEDAHTALKLHRRGYHSAYLAVPQAAGLATESLSGHVAQRIRWARGMAQIMRIDNPLAGKGLQLAQRLCYFNAMLHFFYSLPRMIYLTAPLAFLFFGAQVIHASATMILAYAIPHLFQSALTNLRVQGRHRHLLWNEVYETALAWYILRPTLMAVINPKLGKFNVTPKGGLVERSYFDRQIAKPYLFLLFLNLAGVVAGILRLFQVEDAGAINTIWVNLGWTFYNMLLLGATIATASETRQVRRSHRVPLDIPANLYLPDGRVLACRTRDFSTGGMAVRLQDKEPVEPGMPLHIGLSHRGLERLLPALVRHDRNGTISLQFSAMTMEQERWLVASTFARADIWLSQWGQRQQNSFWKSVPQVLGASMYGFGCLGRHIVDSARQGFRPARAVDERSGG